MTRQMKRVSTLDLESRDDGWLPDEFLMKIAAAVALIPEQHRGRGVVSLATDYESSYARLTIAYQREETDEEHAERIAAVRTREQMIEANERAMYERLKAKFG